MLSDLTVVVAGAGGRMGRLFCTELAELGATVLRLGRRELADGEALSASAGHLTIDPCAAGAPACDTSDAPCAPCPLDPALLEKAKTADIIILCVPIALTGPAAARLQTLLPVPDTAVWIDVASVKELPMRHLAEAVRGPVVGTHPLFGPSARPGAPERRTAIIPGPRSSEKDVALIERLFAALGCVTFRGTAREHDSAVAVFQSLNFLTSAALIALAGRAPALRSYLTPSFQRRVNASRTLMMEDGELFTGLSFQNNELRGELEKFEASLGRFLESPQAALEELAAARSWWAEEDS